MTNGFVSTGFRFDGISQTLTAPAGTNLDVGKGGGFTLEFWMMDQSTSSRPVLGWGVSGGAGVCLFTSSSATVGNFSVNETNGTQHNVTFVWPTQNVWHHLALVYDRSTGVARAYADGVLVGTAFVGNFQAATAGDLVLGSFAGRSDFFLGMLDEISLYDRALNAQEINEIFAAGSIGKCPADINQPPVVN